MEFDRVGRFSKVSAIAMRPVGYARKEVLFQLGHKKL
jgi:hypothetical protein